MCTLANRIELIFSLCFQHDVFVVPLQHKHTRTHTIMLSIWNFISLNKMKHFNRNEKSSKTKIKTGKKLRLSQ